MIKTFSQSQTQTSPPQWPRYALRPEGRGDVGRLVRVMAILIAGLIAIPTASEAITLRADIAGFAQDDADWVALGIAPVDRASLTVTYDETTPAFTVFSDTAGGDGANRVLRNCVLQFRDGQPVAEWPGCVRPGCDREQCFCARRDQERNEHGSGFLRVAISRRPVTLPGGGRSGPPACGGLDATGRIARVRCPEGAARARLTAPVPGPQSSTVSSSSLTRS
jgi:hypothetical protein